jgi:hypothetical protein
LGKGYITQWFPGKLEKQWRLKEVDYRIHFALNCGAKSCPPIAFYQSDKLDQQLDEATIGFLKSTSKYDSERQTITLSKILSWFSGDFGGKKGQIELLKSHGIIPSDKNPKIVYDSYDWTVDLKQYSN